MSRKTTNKDVRLYLVDGSAYIFRAYHALPPLTRKSDGLPIGAVSGFCNMLYKLLTDMGDDHDPTHFAVIFDYSAHTFRNDLYDQYKANREEPPEDLRPQFPLVRDATRAFGLPCIEMEGFEADDIIATYAREIDETGGECVIISSDKDLMQLVTDRVTMYDTMKNRRIGHDEVVEKFGVPPEKVIEVQALAGDSVDNIPGVPGVGVKTAALLIEEFGDLETLLEKADGIKQKKRRENLIEFADDARISKTLVTLKDDLDLVEPIDALKMTPIDPEPLLAFCREMEFNTLTRRISDDFGAETVNAGGAAVAEPADVGAAEYEIVYTEEALSTWIDRARARGVIAVDTETNSLDAMRADLVGVSLATGPGSACYVPLGHGGDGLALGEDDDVGKQMPLKKAIKLLKP
ncbi:MAG: 5'-3' exonuclease H3TH domain-containing protein, partial [Pseudomonadota bacterium]